MVVLRGESGCGWVDLMRTRPGKGLTSRKTTLLKCIAELNVYQAGEIRLNGK